MPNPHFDISIVKRSEGRSAIAGAAYGDVKMDQNANQNKNRQLFSQGDWKYHLCGSGAFQ